MDPSAPQGCATTSPEARLTISLRPGVAFPDWSVVRSGSARATLVAMLEAAWDQRAWQGHTPAEDAMRRTILELYRELEHAPMPQENARRSGMTARRVHALLHRLAERDLVVLEDGRITGAYPLTDRPTEHRVSVEGRRLHAMCAIDALGVGAMYGTSTAIESGCRASAVLRSTSRSWITGGGSRRRCRLGPWFLPAPVFGAVATRPHCAP
jgi:mercuric reductase